MFKIKAVSLDCSQHISKSTSFTFLDFRKISRVVSSANDLWLKCLYLMSIKASHQTLQTKGWHPGGYSHLSYYICLKLNNTNKRRSWQNKHRETHCLFFCYPFPSYKTTYPAKSPTYRAKIPIFWIRFLPHTNFTKIHHMVTVKECDVNVMVRASQKQRRRSLQNTDGMNVW